MPRGGACGDEIEQCDARHRAQGQRVQRRQPLRLHGKPATPVASIAVQVAEAELRDGREHRVIRLHRESFRLLRVRD